MTDLLYYFLWFPNPINKSWSYKWKCSRPIGLIFFCIEVKAKEVINQKTVPLVGYDQAFTGTPSILETFQQCLWMIWGAEWNKNRKWKFHWSSTQKRNMLHQNGLSQSDHRILWSFISLEGIIRCLQIFCTSLPKVRINLRLKFLIGCC